MNIGIDIRCLQDNQLTGVGEYTLNLLRQLFLIDKNNSYYLFANSSKKISLPNFNFTNVTICRFKYPNKLLNLSLWLLKRPRLDLMIQKKFHTPPLDLFFFPNLNFFSTKCPYVITCHDLSYEIYPEFFSPKSRLWHALINPKNTFHQALKIISVSNNTATDLHELFQIPKNKITTILPGIKSEFKILDKKDPRLIAIRKKYSLPKNFILFLGTLEPRKNLLTLLEAYFDFYTSDNGNYHLVIAGKPGWQFKNLRQILKNQPSNKFIHLINYVAPEDKVGLYNLAKLFVYPSIYEGFGFPPLEALKCGCPTIISHTSSLCEVAGDYAITIDPFNINDLSRAMKTALELPPPPIPNLSPKYNWEKTAKETLKIFSVS